MFECLLTLARPYAKAAFDFAFEHQILNKWELMLCYAKNLVQDEIILKLLSYVDIIESIELSEILISIGKHNFDCYGQNFIRVIGRYKRLHLLPVIFKEFLILRQQKEMIIEIQVITVNSLNNNQLLKIISIMKKKLMCKKINIICKLDPSIIGGIIICVNDIVIDGSLRNHIKRLQNVLEI